MKTTKRYFNADITPVCTSRKIRDEFRVKEDKPPVVNQQCVVYVIFSVSSVMQVMSVTRSDTFISVFSEEHKGSTVNNHLREQQSMAPVGFVRCFNILRKCQSKLDCLLFEMLFVIKKTQTNSEQTMRFHPRKIICLYLVLLFCFLLVFFLNLIIVLLFIVFKPSRLFITKKKLSHITHFITYPSH